MSMERFFLNPLALFREEEKRDGDEARRRILIDPVTGLWNNAYRFAIVVQAQLWAAAQCASVYYVEADLSNLGGVNDYLGSNAEANRAYLSPVSRMWNVAVEEIAGSNPAGWSVTFRHGGDEFSAIIGGVHEEPSDPSGGHPITGRLDQLHRDVHRYGEMVGLSKVPHPKGGPKGIGLYYGITRLIPGEDPDQAFIRADSRVAEYKRGLKKT